MTILAKLTLFSSMAGGLSFAISDRDMAATVARMKTDEKITFLQGKLNTEPANAQVESLLASTFLQKLRETMDPVYLQRASALVDRMLTQDARSYAGLRLQNEIDMQRHNFPKVAERSTELLDRNPSDAGTVGMMGDALMEMGRYDEAGKAYLHMIALSPNMDSYNRLAYQRFVTGNTEEALSWMDQAVKAGSKLPEHEAWCLTEFGDLLFKTGHNDDARAAYREAIAALPGYHRANASFGRFLAAQGDFSGAITRLKQAQASVPLPDYAASLAAIYVQTGQNAEAQQQLALIDAIDKLMVVNGETMNRNLAVILADEDRKLDRAIALAKAEFSVRNDVFTYDALSWVLFKQKRYEEAQAASRKAVAENTPDPILHFHAGMIALALKDSEGAKSELNRALRLNPKFDFRFAPEAVRVLGTI